MNGSVRRADPETASARLGLQALAPQLAGLIFCRSMPEAPLAVVLDWSEAIVSADASAFGIERLGEVLPALGRAFVAAHIYGLDRSTGRDIVELYDDGCGSVVGKVIGLAGLVAIGLHGDAGRALVLASRAELADALSRIHALMLRQ